MRGGGDIEVTITSASSDLHSAIYGSAVPNAAVAASNIIASMFNDDGTVVIEGWNDGLTDLSEKERAQIAEAVKTFEEVLPRRNSAWLNLSVMKTIHSWSAHGSGPRWMSADSRVDT